MCYATSHSGYIGVQDYQKRQKWLLDNAQMKKSCASKSVVADRALIRLKRCSRWGRMRRDFYGRGNETLVAANAAAGNADRAGRHVGSSYTGVAAAGRVRLSETRRA